MVGIKQSSWTDVWCLLWTSAHTMYLCLSLCGRSLCENKRETLDWSWAPGGKKPKGCSLHVLHLSWKGSRGKRCLSLNQYAIHHRWDEDVTVAVAGTQPWVAGAVWYSRRHLPRLGWVTNPWRLPVAHTQNKDILSICFRLLQLHAAGMHGNGDAEGLRRQPASQQYEQLGHFPEKQFSDEHIHFLLSGRFSRKSSNKTVQPGPSSHQLHPLPVRTKLSCYSTLKRLLFSLWQWWWVMVCKDHIKEFVRG